MANAQRLGKDELLVKYSEGHVLQRLLNVAQLTEFLKDSILKTDYRIPDQLNDAIALTSYGKRIHQELVTKHDVPAKEARVLCLLVAVYTEPLIDIEKTDLSAIAEAISEQVKDRSLLFPFIFGRELYDRAADLFDDERSFLNYQDTLRLLKDSPAGVFHLGPYLLGPYGMLRTNHTRSLAPRTRIPLHHCTELTCHKVHICALTTNINASINEHLGKIYKVLDKEASQPWAWGEAFGEISGTISSKYDDLSLNTLPYLIGDGLSNDELKTLLAYLMDNTGGALRCDLEKLGLRGDAASCVAPLSRSETMQLLLLSEDSVVVEALDRLVLDRSIVVPSGEIRRPVVNRTAAAGRFAVQVQIGATGCRVHSLREEVGPLRLRRLVDRLYIMDEASDVSELEWQLREVDAPNLSSRLDEYLRSFTPEEVVRRLALARRTNMISACTSLGIDEHRTWSDEDLVSAILWKLDFISLPRPDEHARFWQLHEKMKQVAQTAGVSALVDTEDIRGRASNYFVALERLLDDCLAFTTWALTNDHISSSRPFTYRADEDSVAAFEQLARYERGRDSGPEELNYSGVRTLYTLTRGFGSLSGLLEQMLVGEQDRLRAASDFPRYATSTDLKRFPFKHTVPFLDLLPDSQSTILETLKRVGRDLVSADVSGVRNDQLHFRRSTTDLTRLSSCLAVVESCARALEEAGMTRLLFRPLREQADEWGRQVFTFVDSRGREIAIARPSSFDWLGLPGLLRPQYLVTSGVFSEPSELLRFREDLSSEYSRYWEGYPKRRSHGRPSTASSDVDDIADASVVGDSYTG